MTKLMRRLPCTISIFTDRSFRYVSPCLWNQLPASFHQSHPNHSLHNSKHTFSTNPSHHRSSHTHRTAHRTSIGLNSRIQDRSKVLVLVFRYHFRPSLGTRNGEFCVTVGPATRTAGILVSRLKALAATGPAIRPT